jgi:hypothetical protein
MIWDNSLGQASVEYARGFSGASVEVWGCGWGGVLEPWPHPTFSENPGKILGEYQARRKILSKGQHCRTELWVKDLDM